MIVAGSFGGDAAVVPGTCGTPELRTIVVPSAVRTFAYVPTTNDAMIYTVGTLAGIPDWMGTERYSIDAKVSEPDIAAWQNPATQPAMLRPMMQAMLADRCKLAVHRASREVPVSSPVGRQNRP